VRTENSETGNKERTIKRPVSFSGTGLHTGSDVTMELNAAGEGHGVVFKRTDLPGEPLIPAYAEYVCGTERGTTLEKDGVSVSTVEHILSAIFASGIDNLLIKVNGPEIPIMDGSAEIFASEIEKCGTITQRKNRQYYTPEKEIVYKDEVTGSELRVVPAKDFSVELTVDFNSQVVGRQQACYCQETDYAREIAPARTFVFLKDVIPLLKAGLIKGGALENAVVIAENEPSPEEVSLLSQRYSQFSNAEIREGYLNPEGLRYENECARHKLVDIIGDISLAGRPVKARIIANKSGHKINTTVARIMRKEVLQSTENQIPLFDPNKEPVYDINAIKKLLPHRPPFLMVDRIIDISADKVVGVKTVGINESFFAGHFPDEPVMPGVLIIESMAQVGGILVLSGLDEPERYSTYFAKIDKVKFKRKVVPGDILVIRMYLTSPLRRSIVSMRGEVYIGNSMVCEGEMVAQVIKNK
jgi:UDP-3-O-[3-hydroxymyristoyl] N-acetylglucosamine deacetylase/3-hydroxyacyl-[acyl-carrier-protein] dehydratase